MTPITARSLKGTRSHFEVNLRRLNLRLLISLLIDTVKMYNPPPPKRGTILEGQQLKKKKKPLDVFLRKQNMAGFQERTQNPATHKNVQPFCRHAVVP